jgi:hypothetical protein
VLGVDRRRDRVHQAGQVRRAADLLEPIAPAQLVAEGDEVDRLALAVEREHRLVDLAVLLAVEVAGLEEVPDAKDRIGVDEDRSEDALLRLHRLRRELVEAHQSLLSVPGWAVGGHGEADSGCGRAERPADPIW